MCRKVMLAKNHDYGESWRFMRPTSITDLIWAKVNRIRTLEELIMRGEKGRVDESITDNYMDILNYCVFALIKIKEGDYGR
jgi:hypothetical protein